MTERLGLLLLVSLCFVVGGGGESPPHCEFPALFNFGDSNSDTGGLSAAFGQAPPPNGETYFGKPAGRYSDGRLIVDFIAESLKLPHLSAYLDSIGSNFSHGANFATAGSTILRQNTTLFQSGFSPFSLDVQSWQFSQFKARSLSTSLQGGVFRELLPKEDDYFDRALFTFDIGQNDLTSAYFLNMTTDQVKAYIPQVIDNFVVLVKNLYLKGGRTFWIHNTGPFGCLPYVLDRLPITAGLINEFGCGTPFNEVAQLFNLKLKEAVYQLREACPLGSFTYVDIYSIKYMLITHAKDYGFENNPLEACCGHGGKYNYNRSFGCGSKMTVNGTEVVVGESCKEPLKRVNWDGVHYTEAANRWVFDQVSTGNFSDPPVPISMACHRKTVLEELEF